MDIIEGREYKLLPNSGVRTREHPNADGYCAFPKWKVTRVRALTQPDTGGNVLARALDGTDPGLQQFVAIDFLRPVDEQKN